MIIAVFFVCHIISQKKYYSGTPYKTQEFEEFGQTYVAAASEENFQRNLSENILIEIIFCIFRCHTLLIWRLLLKEGNDPPKTVLFLQ